MKKKSIWLNAAWQNFRTSWATWLFSVTLIIVLPICFRALTVDELGLNMYMALFGVLITAFITNLLLHSQSKQQQDIQMSTKVYSEKIETYKDFLDKLEILLSTKKPSEREIDALTMLLMKMSIHMKYDKLYEISQKFSGIINDKFEVNKKKEPMWRKLLLEIALILRNELYKNSQTGNVIEIEDHEKLGKLQEKIATDLEELDGMLRNEEPDKNSQFADNQCVMNQSTVNSEEKGFTLCICEEMAEQFRSLFKKGNEWSGGIEINEKKEVRPGVMASLRSDIPGIENVLIGFKEDAAHGWIFQFHADFEDDNLRRQCYLAMRRQFGGYLSKWSWYKPIPQEWVERIGRNTPDAKLQQYVMENLTKVYEWVLRYKKMMELHTRYGSEAMKDSEGWKSVVCPIWANYFWTFHHSHSPMCVEAGYSEDESRPNDFEIWITNTNHNKDELLAQLKAVGLSYKPYNGEPYYHCYGQYGSEGELVKALQELLRKAAELK